MNEEQIALIKSNWAAVVPIAGTAADIFYTKLFEMDPSLRTMFPEDLSEQKVKLMKTLGMLVNAADHLEDMLPAVHALGERHVGYGVKEEHYPKVGAALLSTLEAGLGDAWDSEARDAWTALYSIASGAMIDAARKAKTAAAG